MRVAIVHDYLTQRGGAERVVLALHRAFPDAPIYTSIYDPDATYSELRDADVRTTVLQHLHRRASADRGLLPLYPLGLGRLRLRGFDLVVSSSSGWAHAVRAPGGLHVCYCYTPARWLYQSERYLARGGPVPPWAAGALRPILAGLRRWDAMAARRPDVYVAISAPVAARIERCYGRDAVVVHPPVDVGRFGALAEPGGIEEPSNGDPYVIVVARLLPYKRVDLAIRACNRLGLRLVVVGDGPAAPELERLAGPGVQFRRHASDAELARLLAGSQALVQAGEEDFGLAPLEANALGRPVVAYGAGGALETVLPGQTGLLFSEQTPEALAGSLDAALTTAWDSQRIREHARTFDEAHFQARLMSVIETNLAAVAAVTF